jgi:hypothetical protein
MTTGVWTISIGGYWSGGTFYPNFRKYIKLEIHRMLVLNAPTNFTAQIELDPANPVYFMDEVDVFRDGNCEWKGYVEGINPSWSGTDGNKYISLTGRDITMILWKKFNDDFSNFATKTAGMFGTVDPVALLHFILHTPKSDIGIDYPYNKEGWGLDFTASIDVERCNATWGNPANAQWQLGSPQWCFSRQRGYGWSNTSRQSIVASNPDNTVNSALLADNWTNVGGSSTPYIDGNLPNNPPYVNYVTSYNASPHYGDVVTFGIVPYSFGANTLEAATVTITYRSRVHADIPPYFDYGTFDAYIWINSIGIWQKFASLVGNSSGNWTTVTYNVSQFITNPLDFESANLQIKLIQAQSVFLNYGVDIAYISVGTLQGESNASQTQNDAFEIVFKPELLMPIGATRVQDINGLVGEYLLNEGSGTVIHDYSGTNSNATMHSGCSWFVGPVAPLVYFDGTANAYIDCGSSFTWLTGHNGFSFDCWVDITDLSALATHYLINKPNEFYVYIDNFGAITVGLYIGGWVISTSDNDAVTQNERCHIQCLYDGFSINIYLNNAILASYSQTGYISTTSGSADLQIGPLKGYLADVNIYNRAIYPTITALYFECRGNTSAFAQNYTVEYLVNGLYTVIPNTYPSMPVSGNTTQDILISFPPISTQKVRMRLTADGTTPSGVPWSLSQVYVYKTEFLKYKFYLDTGESDPSANRNDNPYYYTGGPYISAFSNQLIGIANPIGPLNVSRQRGIDAINYVVGLCSSTEVGESDVVGFSPFEWWMSYDQYNTFNVKNQKGSDKTATVIFKMDPTDPTNTNLGMIDYKTFIDDTAQNLYVVGQGEQKHLEDCSIWVRSINASGLATNGLALNTAENIVRTFYEDVIQDKTVIITDYLYPAVGNILGCSNLTINAMPRVQLKLQLAEDQYVSMSYDVGDVVTVFDSITGIGTTDLALGHYRIMNIDIAVSIDIGEDVQITLGYPNYKYEDELQTMYRNMKSYGIVGAFNSDWTAEGTDKTLLDANLISASSQYNASAQNDKMAQTIPYDGNLWRTTSYDYGNSLSNTPTVQGGQSGYVDSHFLWSTNNSWFGVMANTDGDIHDIIAVLVGNLIQYYVNSTTVVNGADAADINMYWNPHMVMDVRVLDGTYTDLADANWVYAHWNNSANVPASPADYCRIGIATQDGTQGFWFMIIRNATVSTPATFDVYCQWSLPDGTTNFKKASFNNTNATLGDGFTSPNGSYMQTIVALQKYKLEIVTQSDPAFIATNTPNVQFNLYTYKSIFTTDNAGLEQSYVQLTYPTLGIIVNPQIYNMIVKPLFVEFLNLIQGAPSQSPSGIYFYTWTTNWVIKQIEVNPA